MNPSPAGKSAENDDAPDAGHQPITPTERDAWIGMAATLVLCLAVTVVYFWVSGHGK